MPRICRPVQLLEPASDPAPVAGCDVCRALAGQRAEAYAAGDRSKVSDCNVEIGRHPHRKAGR
ncbi:hypothetical protein ACWD6P_13300 [Streptomyces sp. NPDC002446]